MARKRHGPIVSGRAAVLVGCAGMAGVASAQCDPNEAFVDPVVLNNMTGFGTSGEAEFADVTGDGNLDLLVGQNDVNLDADPDPAGLAVFPGDGAGGFGEPFIVGTQGGQNPDVVRDGPRSIAAGDLDGDGDTDLAIGSIAFEVLINDGSGNFTEPYVFFDTGPGEGINDIAVGDMNGDGDLDIIGTDTGRNFVIIAFNDQDAGFNKGNAALIDAIRPTGTAVADFDNDGDLDLAIANSQASPRSVAVWLNDGAGSFTDAGEFGPLNGGPEDIDAGDFNGDGNLDVVTTNGNQNDGVDVLFGNGDGSFQAPTQVIVPGVDSGQGFPLALEVDAGDIDGDGIDDIAVGVFGLSFDPDALSRIGVLLSNGDGTFRTGDAEAPEAVDRARRVDLGDIDNDGQLEAVLSGSSFSDDTVAVFDNGCAGADCPADLTGPGGDGVPDGTLTSDDFFFYLGLFADGDLDADLTGPGGDGEPDGTLTSDDFFFYLGLFSAGCP